MAPLHILSVTPGHLYSRQMNEASLKKRLNLNQSNALISGSIVVYPVRWCRKIFEGVHIFSYKKHREQVFNVPVYF